jgi:hypothetical protein
VPLHQGTGWDVSGRAAAPGYKERGTMTEYSATIAIAEPRLPGYVLVRVASTAELVASPHVPDELMNTTEARP